MRLGYEFPITWRSALAVIEKESRAAPVPVKLLATSGGACETAHGELADEVGSYAKSGARIESHGAVIPLHITPTAILIQPK